MSFSASNVSQGNYSSLSLEDLREELPTLQRETIELVYIASGCREWIASAVLRGQLKVREHLF